ncbi:MAG: NAD(P)/FAD-dependent oxidoreductase [Nitrospirae bacterium]|nr:NAD(P)/FAD-dependent oxidoreductase [Nitrospirota bacterium]
MTTKIITDVMIIGAGASGLMCAIEAGKRKRSVIVIDHANKAGKKISISGGGRCNFTNLNISPGHYFSGNPDFCRSSLARFTSRDIIRMVERHRIKYIEKEAGQLFCSDSSGDIINMLHRECNDYGVRIYLNYRIKGIKRNENGQGFTVSTDKGVMDSQSLVIATGGLSYPQLGATGFGYDIARQFGLKVTTVKPALVPLMFNPADQKRYGRLSGISLRAEVGYKKMSFSGDILFTHRGLSGPAILQISSLWEKGGNISINLLPQLDLVEYLMTEHRRRVEMKNLLSGLLPGRFAQILCESYIESRPLNQFSEKELKSIAHLLQNLTIQPAGTEGYGKAEVTLGGVDTAELSSKTMEAKNVHGLYFIGEVADVTGQLGGYNLHWAWASGHAAGQYV